MPGEGVQKKLTQTKPVNGKGGEGFTLIITHRSDEGKNRKWEKKKIGWGGTGEGCRLLRVGLGAGWGTETYLPVTSEKKAKRGSGREGVEGKEENGGSNRKVGCGPGSYLL